MQRIHFDELDSTQREARRRFAALGADRRPLVVTAAVQTAAIGRMGRHWASPRGGLWMTVARELRRAPAAYAAAPLTVGRAVVEVLRDELGLSPMIKPPNDILVGGRKLAGILCQLELAPETPYLLVGVGINANFDAAELGEELRETATTVREELGREVDLARLLEAVGGSISRALEELEAQVVGVQEVGGGLRGSEKMLR